VVRRAAPRGFDGLGAAAREEVLPVRARVVLKGRGNGGVSARSAFEQQEKTPNPVRKRKLNSRLVGLGTAVREEALLVACCSERVKKWRCVSTVKHHGAVKVSLSSLGTTLNPRLNG
jgi:hypothetical protein